MCSIKISRFLFRFLPRIEGVGVGGRKQKLHSHNTFLINKYISTNNTLLKHFTY